MLADAIGAALPDLRAEAESLMTSTCVINRPGAQSTDPDTGEVTAAAGDEVYRGKCAFRPAVNWGRTAEAGGEQVNPLMFKVSIPYSASGVRRGDVLAMLTSADPDVVGRTFEVKFTPALGDFVTARRLLCEEPD